MIAESREGQSEHEMIEETLPAAALDALSNEEMRSVTAHADRCEPCRAELAALRRYVTQLSYAAPLEPIDRDRSDRVRKQLIARAQSDRQPSAISSANLAPRKQTIAANSVSNRRVFGWLATAALAASIVALAVLIRDRGNLAANVASERRDRMEEAAALRSEISERDATLAALTGPAVKVITLTALTARPAGALMFWDRATDQWTFIAHDLPPLGPARTYQLWLVIGAIPKSVGVFTPDALGNARMSARVPLDSNARPRVAVTDEPVGGSSSPTSDPIVFGQVSG